MFLPAFQVFKTSTIKWDWHSCIFSLLVHPINADLLPLGKEQERFGFSLLTRIGCSECSPLGDAKELEKVD